MKLTKDEEEFLQQIYTEEKWEPTEEDFELMMREQGL